jgi:hypothetical protein
MLGILIILGLYALSWTTAFLSGYLPYRRLWKQFYGEPTKDTLWTAKHYPEKRQFMVVLRERGMEEYDTVVIRTPWWEEVEVMIPRPVSTKHL